MSYLLVAEIDVAMIKQLVLAFFLGMFLIVLVRLWLAKPDQYERDAMIPLDDDPVELRAAGLDSSSVGPDKD